VIKYSAGAVMKEPDQTEANSSERRKEPRRLVNLGSLLMVDNEISFSTIIDVSEHGIALNSTIAVEVTSEIEISPQQKDRLIKAEVMSCRATEEGYRIGAKLTISSDLFKELPDNKPDSKSYQSRIKSLLA